MLPRPDSPASSRFQTCSRPWPRGVIRPIPVTTTRRIFPPYENRRGSGASDAAVPKLGEEPKGSGPETLLDELHRIAHGLDVLGRVVGDLDVEFFLERHDEFDI